MTLPRFKVNLNVLDENRLRARHDRRDISLHLRQARAGGGHGGDERQDPGHSPYGRASFSENAVTHALPLALLRKAF